MSKEPIEKGPACRQADESFDECVSRKIAELMGVENWNQDRAIAAARRMCGKFCSEKDQPDSSLTTTSEAKAMPTLEDAVIVEDQAEFDSLSGQTIPVEIHYNLTTPLIYDEKASEGMLKDVKVRGPVYVGSDEMLDRHDELVTAEAIMSAWKGYSNNPVILYNHSKTYGVIGRMTSVTMGKFNGITVPIGTAIIDGGEKDITRKIRKGMLKAFSIGFIAKAGVKVCDDEKESCYMKFTEIDWVETSVVDVPASPDALFSVQKSVQWDSALTDVDNSDKAAKSDCGCGCSDDCSESNEKHVVRIEEDENFITIVYGKSDEWEGIDVDSTGAPMEAGLMTEEESGTKTVKNPVVEGLDSMTTEELDTITADAEAEETLSAVPVEEEAPVETPIETKDAPEEVVEDLSEEEVAIKDIAAEAEAEEEVVEDAPMPSPREALGDIAYALNSIIERLDAQDAPEEVETEDDELTRLRAEVAELRSAEEARVKEAELEAEVERRVAEKMADMDAPAPARKSIVPEAEEAKENPMRFDPNPTASKGMNGLADWLSSNLSSRGA